MASQTAGQMPLDETRARKKSEIVDAVGHGIARQRGRPREDGARLREGGRLGVAGREPHRLGREERAHAEQLAREHGDGAIEAACHHVLGQERGRALAPEVEDHGAGSAPALHHAHAREVAQRLAHRAAATGQRGREVGFRRQTKAGGVRARDDPTEDLVGDASDLSRRTHELSGRLV
ncbi:MAG: hypothetical protein QM820_42320 [Minicystis sp.]